MDLALFSGKPLFDTPQHVGGPIVEEETRRRFYNLSDFAFDRNHLTNNGPLAQNLEEEVADRHGVKEAVFMANATLAQLVLMKALKLAGGEAVVSANTFVATPHVCEWLGMKPVFCDIDPATLNMDPVDLANRITSETKVIIPTHVFGVLADLPAITDIAIRHNLPVVVDAAHAFDCDRDGVKPGGFEVPEFLSFHATKFFSTLEGGAVLTNDTALAGELRALRNFGYTAPEVVTELGINAKGSEIAAAFGLASLPALDGRRRRLEEVGETYREALAGLPGVRIHSLTERGGNNFRYFALFIEDAFGVCPEAVHQALQRENVLARRYFHPGCQRLDYYRERYPDQAMSLPAAEEALDRILCLPTSSSDMDAFAMAKGVSALLTAIHEQADRIGEWWLMEDL